MTLKIEIKMDNAAFGDCDQERGAEVSRILKHTAEVIENLNMGLAENASMNLRDFNGNKVGTAEVVE